MRFVRSLLLAVALLLLLCIPSSTSFAQATTYTVTNTNDSGVGSLRQAILDANANAGADTIIFQAGLTGTITLTSRLEISGDVTISGPGAAVVTVDGNNATQLIYNTAPTQISGLSLVKGSAEQGAGIENRGQLILRDLILRDHFVTFYGAAIFNGDLQTQIGASLSIINCRFENNRVNPADPYHAGAAIFSYGNGTITITGSQFIANQAADGGALYLMGDQVVEIADSLFKGNVSSGTSAIRVQSGTGAIPLRIQRTEILQNVSLGTDTYWTPALRADGVVLDLRDSLIMDNTGSGVFARYVSAVGNSIQRTAIINNSEYALRSVGPIRISNSTFYGPRGIWAEAGGVLTLPPIELINVTASANDVAIQSENVTTILKNSLLINRAANATAACSLGTYNDVLIDGGGNIQFPGKACGEKVFSADPLLNAPADNGGNTYTMAPQPGSYAIDAGDNAICAAEPINNIDQRGSPRPIDGNQFEEAVCDVGAYEAPLNSSPPPPTFVVTKLANTQDGSCTLTDCSLAEAFAAAPHRSYISFVPGLTGNIVAPPTGSQGISKSVIVIGPGADVISLVGFRIGIASDVSVQISGLTISGNRFYGSQGGALQNSGELVLSQMVFVDNEIVATGSASGGAAIWNTGKLTISQSLFYNNRVRSVTTSGSAAYVSGGAIQNDGTLTLVNSTINGNYAIGTLPQYGNGGGLSLSGSHPVQIINSTIAGNYASDQGGNIYHGPSDSGLVTISNSIISGGGAPEGPDILGDVHLGAKTLIQTMSGTTISSGGSYLIAAQDPRLGGLAFMGGHSAVLPLLSGSPAIDVGDNTTCAATLVNARDQRDMARPIDGDGNGSVICDLGAFERQAPIEATPSPVPTFTPTPAPTERPPDTIGIYRPSTNTFYLRNSNSTGFSDITASLASVGMNPSEYRDVPVLGDWNGDNIDTIGFYRRGRASDGAGGGLFILTDSNTNPQVTHSFVLGNPGDTPLVGDWDGDGRDSVGVFRPSNGLIYIKNELSTGFADYTMVLGNPGDIGIAGDWDDDGKDSPGVYRPGANPQFYLTNQLCNCVAFSNYNVSFGDPGDQPFTGDWNGDGRTGLGVYRTSNGITYLRNDPTTTGFSDFDFVYGVENDFAFGGVWISASPPSVQIEVAPTFQP